VNISLHNEFYVLKHYAVVLDQLAIQYTVKSKHYKHLNYVRFLELVTSHSRIGYALRRFFKLDNFRRFRNISKNDY
jgi:hypothetical protein